MMSGLIQRAVSDDNGRALILIETISSSYDNNYVSYFILINATQRVTNSDIDILR